MDNNRPNRVAVLGGNGFVGQRVLEQLVKRGHDVTCFSRSGKKPHYLNKAKDDWTNQVDWRQVDGCALTVAALESFDTLLSLVGAAPIPTLTAAQRRKQQALNSSANVHALEVAKQAGVKNIGLVGAHIPRPLRNAWFGYFLGKRDSLRAAKAFCNAKNRSACVVQPGLVVGRRYLAGGRSIRLDVLLGPLKRLSFGYFIDVEQLATILIDGTMRNNLDFENLLDTKLKKNEKDTSHRDVVGKNPSAKEDQGPCTFRQIDLRLLKKIN